MEEFFLHAVERVGYPVAVSVACFYALYKLFQMRETDRNGLLGQIVVEAKLQTISLSSIAEDRKNQSAILSSIDKKVGSDQGCKVNPMHFAEMIASTKLTNNILEDLRQEAIKAAEKVADKSAMEIKEKIDQLAEKEARHNAAQKAAVELNMKNLAELAAQQSQVEPQGT